MKTFATLAATAALLVPSLWAQSQFEVGALGLISDYRSVAVTNGASSGEVGPGLGFSGGFVLGQTVSNHWGGEFRYLYFRNDLELAAGGQEASFDSQSHAVHYDVLYYLRNFDARVRPYVASGVGLKFYQGTGTEDPFQPLSNLALLTKTTQAMLMGDFGAGVKIRVGRRAAFRVEFRDYITGVPKDVIAAAPGAAIDGGLLHQWAPLFGFTWTW